MYTQFDNLYTHKFDVLMFCVKEHKIQDAVETLKKSAQNSTLQYKHSAGLLLGNKLVSIGINRYFKEQMFRSQIFRYSIHAEVAALLKSEYRNVKGLDILIIRIGKSAKLANSRPCNACIDKLREKGIRKAYYSNANGEIVYEFIDAMPKLHETSGNTIKYRIQCSCD